MNQFSGLIILKRVVPEASFPNEQRVPPQFLTTTKATALTWAGNLFGSSSVDLSRVRVNAPGISWSGYTISTFGCHNMFFSLCNVNMVYQVSLHLVIYIAMFIFLSPDLSL
jgi:hypothetical protein